MRAFKFKSYVYVTRAVREPRAPGANIAKRHLAKQKL